jgi:hypothetical protein
MSDKRDLTEVHRMFDEGWCRDCLQDLKDCVAAGCCLGGKEARGENTVQPVSRRRDEEEGDR